MPQVLPCFVFLSHKQFHFPEFFSLTKLFSVSSSLLLTIRSVFSKASLLSLFPMPRSARPRPSLYQITAKVPPPDGSLPLLLWYDKCLPVLPSHSHFHKLARTTFSPF